MKLLYRCELPGRPIVKKNTQRTVGRGRATRRISTPRFIQWELQALVAVKRMPQIPTLTSLIYARYTFCFENHQAEADVSNLCEAPGDLLQKAGVIKDDRLIVALFAQKEFGLAPKTIIELYDAAEGVDYVDRCKSSEVAKAGVGHSQET